MSIFEKRDLAINLFYSARAFDSGKHIEKNMKMAAQLYTIAAYLGNTDAMTFLGMCYWNGEGIDRDEKKAISLYQSAINNEKPNSRAMMCLASVYEVGSVDVAKDIKQSLALYQRACKFDEAYAMYKVGTFFENGIGVDEDHKQAFEMYKESHKKGHKNGTYELARCYERGIGVEKNENLAEELYIKSGEWSLFVEIRKIDKMRREFDKLMRQKCGDESDC
jgi:TPR repeat protein